MLSLNEGRCIGHGCGPSGHQLRVDCVNCQRQTAPRPAGFVWYMAPPESKEYPCPMRIPVEVRLVEGRAREIGQGLDCYGEHKDKP